MNFFRHLVQNGRLTLPFAFFLPLFALSLAACSDEEAGDPASDPLTESAVDLWNVEKGIGPVHTYSLRMTIDQVATMAEKEMVSKMTSEGTVRMRKTDSSTNGVTWTSILKMSLSGEAAGVPIPSNIQEQRIRYLLSPEGEVLNVAMQSDDPNLDETIQQVLQSVNERQNAAQFFMQKEWYDREVGESWEETLSDTIVLDSVSFQGTELEGGLNMTFNIKSRYTYRGEIDTLGMPMIRIDTEVLEMKVDGAIVTEQMTMNMSSRGGGTGTGYFDPVSGLYTISLSRQKMTTSMVIPAIGMNMPMEQDMTLRSVRTDLVGEGRNE